MNKKIPKISNNKQKIIVDALKKHHMLIYELQKQINELEIKIHNLEISLEHLNSSQLVGGPR